MTKKHVIQKKKSTQPSITAKKNILDDLREIINKTKDYVASTINSSLTLLYWHVGNRIQREILQGERAEYGRSIIVSLSQQLTSEYGNGFNSKNLYRMVQFSEIFPDEQIVVSLTRQLSWTHFVTIIPIQDSLKRDFYAEMCGIEKWNIRTLRKKIDSMLYERTALSKKPELVVQAELEMLRKMELYLRWLDKHERNINEEPPIGLILCAGKKSERVELLELDRAGIHVAEYLTAFPSKEMLKEKLHNAIKHARQRLEIQKDKETL